MKRKCSAYRVLNLLMKPVKESFCCIVNDEVVVSSKFQFVAIRLIQWCRVLPLSFDSFGYPCCPLEPPSVLMKFSLFGRIVFRRVEFRFFIHIR